MLSPEILRQLENYSFLIQNMRSLMEKYGRTEGGPAFQELGDAFYNLLAAQKVIDA